MTIKRSGIGWTSLSVVVAFVAVVSPSTSRGDAHPHAALPPEYAKVAAPPGLWTDSAMIARGRSIYAEKCAICHGERGDGKTPEAAGMRLKAPDLTDGAMVAFLPDAYWFWRVSEGGA